MCDGDDDEWTADMVIQKTISIAGLERENALHHLISNVSFEANCVTRGMVGGIYDVVNISIEKCASIISGR